MDDPNHHGILALLNAVDFEFYYCLQYEKYSKEAKEYEKLSVSRRGSKK